MSPFDGLAVVEEVGAGVGAGVGACDGGSLDVTRFGAMEK